MHLKFEVSPIGTVIESSVNIVLIADQQMTNNIVRVIPKTFLERVLCYYFFPKSITSKEYHDQILVENIKNWLSYDLFSEKAFCAMIS